MACIAHESTFPYPPCLQRKLVPHLISCCSVSCKQQTDLPHSYCAGSTLQDDTLGRHSRHRAMPVGAEWKVFLWAGLGTWFCRLQPTCTCRSQEQQNKSAGKWRCVANVAVEDRRSGSHAVEPAVLRARKMFQDWIGSTAHVHVTSWRTVARHCTGIGIHSILNCCKL